MGQACASTQDGEELEVTMIASQRHDGYKQRVIGRQGGKRSSGNRVQVRGAGGWYGETMTPHLEKTRVNREPSSSRVYGQEWLMTSGKHSNTQ